ncbi:hypothetical protein QJS04_geneDACA006516 [Acorus gramineus]|uniref:Uncharacterized protein n=1 Tax=Acorus gramineus TaxID=55184 RepID=A0AAV9AWJ0_ACOGR|nr:hypothetical protein QJS04_geneDACA006516 [Acorus gramineus]
MVPCLQLHTDVSKSMHDTLQGFELVPVPRVSVVDDHKVELHSTYRESLTLYNQLYHEIIKYVREGAETIDTYNVAMSALQEAIKKVTAAKRTRTGNTHNEDSGMKTCQGTELVLVPDGHASHTHSSGRKRKFQKADKDIGNIASIQKFQVLDSVRISQANSNLSNSTGTTGPLDAETQLIEISHVPVTLCIPVARSLKVASPAPAHPISSTLMKALPLSAHPHASSRTAATKIPPQKKLRAGNPLVHAAAIAAGARVVPPTAAAELIRAVEARVRYAKSVLGGSGPLEAVPLAVWSGDQCVASPEFREIEGQPSVH